MQAVAMQGKLREQVIQALGQTALFRSLKPEQIEALLGAASLLQLDEGEFLTRQGDPSDSFFLLLSGTAAVVVERKKGEPLEIGRMQPPESLGEIGLLLGQPRSATVVASERAMVVKFDGKSFQQMFEKVPWFGLAVSRGLSYRLQLLSYRAPLVRYSADRGPAAETVAMLPLSFLQRHRVLPLESKGKCLTLGFVDDPSAPVITAAQQLLPGMEIDAVRIEADLFNQALQGHAGVEGWSEARAGKARKARGAAAARSGRLDKLVERMVGEGASDLHLSAGHRPRWRIDGLVREIGDVPVLGAEEVLEMLDPVLDPRHREEFEAHHDVDLGYSIPGVARVRINLFRDLRGVSAAVRLISDRIMTFDQLGLPESIARLSEHPKGLVLVTGPTGSGKSSTLAAMVDHINRSRAAHIITLEDPIEFVHQSQQSLIQQREVGAHTVSFARALRAALREDPNVVLVGELRDLESMALALEAANTGMLVLATLHTNSAVATIDRVVDLFPAEQQGQVRSSLADVLRGVVAQTLCRRVGGGRVVAAEVLVVNPAVSNLIREAKTNQIPNIMQTARQEGNYILNEELARLVNKRQVEYDEALGRSTDKKDLAKRLNRPDPGGLAAPAPAAAAPPRKAGS